MRVPLDRLAVQGRELDPVAPDHRDLGVLQDDHVPRVGEDRRDIGRDDALAGAQAHHDRAGAVLGGDEAIRRLRRNHADGVGAAELPERALDRILQAGGVFEVALDQMRQHLRVGLGLEGVALGQEPLLDREVIFQNAVVDHHEGAAAVGVRVGVLLGGAAVGGPARVPEPHAPLHRLLPQDRLELLDAPGAPPDLQPLRPQHGHAGGVIAAVLEPLEPVQDDADGAPLPDVADDPAHYLWLAFFFCLRRAAQPALVTCLPRATASAPGGTSLVMVEPAPT